MSAVALLENKPKPPLSNPALEEIIRHLSFYTRDKFCRHIPAVNEVSKNVPYNITWLRIDCRPNSYAIGIMNGDDLFTLHFNESNMNRQSGDGTPFEKVLPYSGNIAETFGSLIKQYVGNASGPFKSIGIYGLPPVWPTEKRLTIGSLFLNIGIGENQQPICKFLDQLDDAKKISIGMYRRDNFDVLNVLNNAFFDERAFELKMSQLNVENILHMRSRGCSVCIEDRLLFEPVANLAQELVKKRDIGFFITLSNNDLNSSIIENIFDEGYGWTLKPHNDTLAISYAWFHKEISVSYDVSKRSLRMEITAFDSLRPFSIKNGIGLGKFNEEITRLSYKDRKLRQAEFPWESCLKYKLENMEINFDSFDLTIDGDTHGHTSVTDLLRNLALMLYSNETWVFNLTIIGTTEMFGTNEFDWEINAENISLIYTRIHSESFFHFFGTSHGKLMVTSLETVKHGQRLIDQCGGVKIINNQNDQ